MHTYPVVLKNQIKQGRMRPTKQDQQLKQLPETQPVN